MSDTVHRTVRVIDSAVGRPEISIIEGRGNARVVVWPGDLALHRSLHLITLESSARTIAMNHAGDSVYYVTRGGGVVLDESSGQGSDLVEGSIVHIDAGDSYRLVAGTSGMTVVGGPCPPDPSLYATLTSEN